MKRILAWAVLAATVASAAAQSLDECQEAALNNYPLIRKYELIRQTVDATVGNIDKGWLPQISALAQVTVQNKVVELPGAMTHLMTTQGVDFKGLAKEQYKIGVDISQNIYDGGQTKGRKYVARQQSVVDLAQNDVSLYALRLRINELYFGLLLIDGKLQLNRDLQTLLLSNEKKLAAMVKSGTAATADLYAVQAERMNAKQMAVELETQQHALKKMLSLFTGKEIISVFRPADADVLSAGSVNNRPELQFFNAQVNLADAQACVLDARLRPTLSAFAQGYYGYPGYNMYKDMMTRTPSLNGMVGLRLAWNIGALYTRKNDKVHLQMQREQAENRRDVFLFNNKLETIRQNANIVKYRKLMEQDLEIISLRSQVRRAAESKLEHGIIDVNDLIKEINSENSAKQQLSIHDTELLKESYNLKYTVNN